MDANYYLSKQYADLKKSIFDIILSNGMKKTTMDLVASTLSISKRTLYEIFDSKEQMIKVVMSYNHSLHFKEMSQIFSSSDTVMEAFYLTTKNHQKLMRKTSPDFFRDMDNAYANMRPVFDEQHHAHKKDMLNAIELGKRQGVFREDINYPILLRMVGIQMESLKRMENVLPCDVSLSDAFDTITMSFLRSIGTIKGLEILDNIRKTEINNN